MGQSADNEHLKLLVIFHYFVGGAGALLSCIPLVTIPMSLGLLSLVAMADPGADVDQYATIGMSLIIATLLFLVGQGLSWAILYSGLQIRRRERYQHSYVVSCVLCLFFPLGTALGVFTLLVLSRDSVKALYDSSGARYPDIPDDTGE